MPHSIDFPNMERDVDIVLKAFNDWDVECTLSIDPSNTTPPEDIAYGQLCRFYDSDIAGSILDVILDYLMALKS